MNLRIAGYTLVLIGFGWAIFIIWPSLHGKYLFMPPQVYKIPKDTGEMVSAHTAFMNNQTIIQINQDKQDRILDKQAGMLYPILMMLFGAVIIDFAGRQPIKKVSEKTS
jgi:hypothetical protein